MPIWLHRLLFYLSSYMGLLVGVVLGFSFFAGDQTHSRPVWWVIVVVFGCVGLTVTACQFLFVFLLPAKCPGCRAWRSYCQGIRSRHYRCRACGHVQG